MNNWLEQETKRANRNLLLVNGVLLAALFVALSADWQYYVNFVLGCKPVNAAELSSLTSPSQRFRNFVTVQGTKSFDSGYQDIVQHVEESSGRVTSTDVHDDYIALLVGDKVLLVKAPEASSGLEFSGQLVPTTDAVRSDLIGPITKSTPELAARILPFTLDATDYRTQGYWALGIGLPLFLLVCWNCSKAVKRSAEPQLAPTWRMASAYGNPEQISTEIGTEMQTPPERYGSLRLTRSWLIKKSLFSTWISPVHDIVWAYKKTTKHSVNLIPTGKTYSAVLIGRHKQRVEDSMKEKTVHKLLEDLSARVPWALYGYNKDLENAWKSDAGGFVAAIDKRRQEFEKPVGAHA